VIRFWAVLTLLSLPAGALAQDTGGFGLDLTQPDEKKPDDKKPGETQKEPDAAAPAEGATATAAATPADASGTAAADQKPAADANPAERDITQDDRVKSVQRKLYLKTHRFEITPMISASVNDPFYTKWGGILRVGYYLADTLAVVGRGSILQTMPTDDVRLAKRTFQSRINYSIPEWLGMADLEWSPIYGKVAFLNSILHFDAYLLAGAGAVNVAAADAQAGRPTVAGDLGIGLRFVTRDWLAVTVSVINTIYVDTPSGTTMGATQNMLTANAGISIFFPFRSTGKEAE